MSDDHDHVEEHFLQPRIAWERPYYTIDGKHSPLKIFDGLPEEIPQWINAVCISLDGRMKGDLHWKKQHQNALEYCAKGLEIFWDLDLGLFSSLQFPLRHQGQYQSLGLALDHFRKTIWPEFEKSTIGICLYRGLLDISDTLLWDEDQTKSLQEWVIHYFKNITLFKSKIKIDISDFSEITHSKLKQTKQGAFLLQLFCREITREYLELLLSFLPETIQSFALFDLSQIQDPLHAAMLTVNERDRRIHSILSNTSLPLDGLGWNTSSISGYLSKGPQEIKNKDIPKIALCLPPLEQFFSTPQEPLEHALNQLIEKKIPFRLIAEATLTAEWDGLDEILVHSPAVSSQGARMLKGFLAAGGRVTYLE